MAIDFTISTEIARPPDEVFAFVTDPARLHEWQSAVIEVEATPPGPLTTGSRLREVREIRGRRMEQLVEVAELTTPSTFNLRVLEGALPVHGDLTFEPCGAGTRVTLHAFGEARGAMRLLSPLLGIGLKREFAKQYAALRSALEGRVESNRQGGAAHMTLAEWSLVACVVSLRPLGRSDRDADARDPQDAQGISGREFALFLRDVLRAARTAPFNYIAVVGMVVSPAVALIALDTDADSVSFVLTAVGLAFTVAGPLLVSNRLAETNSPTCFSPGTPTTSPKIGRPDGAATSRSTGSGSSRL